MLAATTKPEAEMGMDLLPVLRTRPIVETLPTGSVGSIVETLPIGSIGSIVETLKSVSAVKTQMTILILTSACSETHGVLSKQEVQFLILSL